MKCHSFIRINQICYYLSNYANTLILYLLVLLPNTQTPNSPPPPSPTCRRLPQAAMRLPPPLNNHNDPIHSVDANHCPDTRGTSAIQPRVQSPENTTRPPLTQSPELVGLNNQSTQPAAAHQRRAARPATTPFYSLPPSLRNLNIWLLILYIYFI